MSDQSKRAPEENERAAQENGPQQSAPEENERLPAPQKSARTQTSQEGAPQQPQKSERDLRAAYREIRPESFPEQIELSFISSTGARQTLRYAKMQWRQEGEEKGMRYGENPEQRAALYRLTNDRLFIDNIEILTSDLGHISASEFLQSGKHPGKINIFDLDCAIRLMRYMMSDPLAIIIKHNNPCAVAYGARISEAFWRAYQADAISAFGGVVALNRALDIQSAEMIAERYFELVAAPEYEEGALRLLQKKKNLRIVHIHALERLAARADLPLFEVQSLSDLTLCLQDQYRSSVMSGADIRRAEGSHKGQNYRSEYELSAARIADAIFGWHVVEALWSNAIVFVKNGATVGLCGGAADRVGAVDIAIARAYRNYKEGIARERLQRSYASLSTPEERNEIDSAALLNNGGLADTILASDAFFPFPDSVERAMRERIAAVIEPGGSVNDWQVIEACNRGATPLLFTNTRAFRH